MAQEREDFANILDDRSEKLSILEEHPPEFCAPAQIDSGQPSVGVPGFKRSAEKEGERKPLEAFLRPICGLDLPGQEHLERYVHYKHLLNRKPATLQNTVQAGKLFLGFLNERGTGELEQVSREDLEGFLEHEQDRGLKPSSVKTRWTGIRAFLNYLIKEEVLDPQLLRRTIRIRVPESLPRAIDPEDVKRLLAVLNHTRDRALILLLLRTGMRIGELLNTKVDDVDFRERKIQIPQAMKNAVGRVVYFGEDARQALEAWMRRREPDKEFLFYAQRKHTMGYGAARAMFAKYLVKAGLQHKGYSLHRLRHTFASEMLNAGMRLECLQQLLGHSSIEVTRRYARLTDKTREEEYFRTMEIIETGGIHGHYQFDSELQAFLEEKKLLD
jgi:site-specific recombinase XerD